jgi:DNA-binding transcriptional ArsR family regulator
VAGQRRDGRKARTAFIVLGDSAGAGEPVVLKDKSAVGALADPFRLRIMKLLATPSSARELAGELERPVTSLYHHLDLLEEHGLITVVDVSREGRTFVRRYARVSDTFATEGEIADLAELARAHDPNQRVMRVELTKRIAAAVTSALDHDAASDGRRVRMLMRGRLDGDRLGDLSKRLSAVVHDFFDEADAGEDAFEVVITVAPARDDATPDKGD